MSNPPIRADSSIKPVPQTYPLYASFHDGTEPAWGLIVGWVYVQTNHAPWDVDVCPMVCQALGLGRFGRPQLANHGWADVCFHPEPQDAERRARQGLPRANNGEDTAP